MSYGWPSAHYSPSSSAASSQLDLSSGFPFNPLPADPSTSLLQRSNSGRSSASNNSVTSTQDSLGVQPQTKGGCWTCRIRRKRCDELRDGGSCHTCSRLGINCLGWGTQKPDWMRNKQCVDAYKAEIKAHLTRAGLIRGQPRTAALRLQPVSLDTLPYRIPPVVAMAGLRRASATNGPGLATPNPRHSYPVFSDLHSGRGPSTLGFNDTDIYQLPSAAQSEPAFINKFDRDYTSQIHLTPSQPIAAYASPLPNESYSTPQSFPNIPDVPTLFPFEFGIGPQDNFASSQSKDYPQYYFKDVAEWCKPFGTAELNEPTYSLLLQDQHGSLATVLAALSTCHEARIKGDEQGLQLSQRLYDDACHQLSSSRMLSPYHEYEAFTAIHLISYSIFNADSTGSWRWPFEVLVEWVSQTGILNQEQPSLALQAASTATFTAILLTLWIDSICSLPLQLSPHFLALSRAIFQDDSPCGSACNAHLQRLIGCSGAILVAFAETASLARWKAMNTEHLAYGGYEELIQRRRSIEDQFYRNKQRPPMHTSQNPNFTFSSHAERGFRLLFDLNIRVVGGNLTAADSTSIANAALELAASHPSESPYAMLPVLLACGLLVDPPKRGLIRRQILVGQWPFSNSHQLLQELEAMWDAGPSDGCYTAAQVQHFTGSIFSKHLVL